MIQWVREVVEMDSIVVNGEIEEIVGIEKIVDLSFGRELDSITFNNSSSFV